MHTVRCHHGELFAVCRQCPPDPLRPIDTDEEPWTVVPEPVQHGHRLAVLVTFAALCLVALYLMGRNQ
jgi:heme A synthase